MSTSAAENKEIVLRFFDAISNNQTAIFDEIVAEDYIDHLPGRTPGRESLKAYFAGLHETFGELKFPIWQIIAEGDRVVVFNSIQGKHQQDYAGLVAKGNYVDAQAFQLYRISNGQLAEHWEVADFAALLQQIQA